MAKKNFTPAQAAARAWSMAEQVRQNDPLDTDQAIALAAVYAQLASGVSISGPVQAEKPSTGRTARVRVESEAQDDGSTKLTANPPVPLDQALEAVYGPLTPALKAQAKAWEAEQAKVAAMDAATLPPMPRTKKSSTTAAVKDSQKLED